MFNDLQPGKHLVFDHVCVADTYRLSRVVHSPRRDPVEPVLCPGLPWEDATVRVVAVKHDSSTGQWRMWYTAYHRELAEKRKSLGRSKYGTVGEPQPHYLCYATSDDGINWQRPDLGIYDQTNICFKGVSGVPGPTILFRPEAEPKQRYVLINCEWPSEGVGGIYLAYSGDGIHWAYPPDPKPLIHGESDCTNNCIGTAEGGYLLYLRGWHTAAIGWITDWIGGPGYVPDWHKNTRRRVACSYSTDLENWSEPQVIYTPDELDTNDFYGLVVFRYADMLIGQLQVYDDDAAETIDIELAWSRDGVCWHRHPKRPKFIACGQKGDPDGYMIFPAQEPVAVGDALYLYVTEHRGYPHDAKHGCEAELTQIYRTKLRMDGFISLNADRRLGCMITRPFTLQSDRITINAATQGGRIVAELVEPYSREPEGKPIEGFAAADFDVFETDSVAHCLSWNGSADVSCLKGRRLMLRLSMYHAQLYSFTV